MCMPGLKQINYPSLKLVFESLTSLFQSLLRLTDWFILRRLVDFLHRCDQSGAASSLSLVAVGMTEALMCTDKVRLVGQLYNNLKSHNI